MRTPRVVRAGHSRRPLDHLLGLPSSIAVLRVLRHSTVPVSGREIAREAGLSPQAAHDALARLEIAGMLRRFSIGASHGHVLNRGHLLARAVDRLLSAEESWFPSIRATLADLFRRLVDSARLYGSVARARDGPQSDWDVCAVVRDPRRLGKLEEEAARATPDLWARHGVRLSTLAATLENVDRRIREGDRLCLNILHDGVHLTGVPLERLLHDAKGKARAR